MTTKRHLKLLQSTQKNPAAGHNFRCQVCGSAIPAGGLFYVCRTRITSGSDGIIQESAGSPEIMIESAIREIAATAEEELMNAVYEEIQILLCGGCRKIIRQKLLAMIRW